MPSDAATIAGAVGLFTDAYTLALNPGTRTQPTVADKEGKKAAMIGTIRFYAQSIKRNRGISNEAKVKLGLRIDLPPRAAIPAPGTSPVLNLSNGGPLQHFVRFKDVTASGGRAKPPGIKALVLSCFIGAEELPPGMEFASMPVCAIITRQPYPVVFTHPDKGKTALYAARWMTASGLLGPWSGLARLTIAG
jgi:hypothetical protein